MEPADHGGTFFYGGKMSYPLKQPKNYKEQITHLRDKHKLIINDEQFAEDILQRVSYYRLSAYGIGLHKQNNKEHFEDGINIEHLYNLYQFDCCLRNLIMPVIESLEIELRSKNISTFGYYLWCRSTYMPIKLLKYFR